MTKSDLGMTKHSHLSVSNFGPIEKAELDLRPLTVFAGPSNTGKSYLAVLIYALHQFFGGNSPNRYHQLLTERLPIIPDRIPDEVKGKEETLYSWIGSLFDLVDQHPNNRNERSAYVLPNRVADYIRPYIKSTENFSSLLGGELCRCFGLSESNRLIRRRSNGHSYFNLSCYSESSKGGSQPLSYNFGIHETETTVNVSVPSNMPILIKDFDQILSILPKFYSEPTRSKRSIASLVRSLLYDALPEVLGPFSKPAHYLPADRTGIMHVHQVVVSSLIGREARMATRGQSPLPTLSGVVADFLERIVQLGYRPMSIKGTSAGLARRLESKILRGSIRIDSLITGYPSFHYQPQGWESNENLPLMNASSMVSELAPVVLYLRHIVQSNDVLIIEEPESHLHPEMQVELLRFLVGVMRSGIRVVLTTHSDWIMEELANIIRTSALPEQHRYGIDGVDAVLDPAEVGVWSFRPNERQDGCLVDEVTLDLESGTIPAGFDEASLSLYNKWSEVSNRIDEVS